MTLENKADGAISEEVQAVLSMIEKHHDQKIGYVVYRCTYKDDAQWEFFLKCLDAYVDPSLAIRIGGNYFNDWVDFVSGIKSVTRYTSCIYADEEVVQAVLNGHDPYSTDSYEFRTPSAYVKLLTDDFEDDSEDEGYDPIDGCRLMDVGWRRMAAITLLPRAYNMLKRGGWAIYYERPPKIQRV
ncbi:hypothetical protein Slin15195_G091390 [Septoria linicola]|uniref:Uncharacterized protein n=1 Tax=Septoria linicola TaxID=215465 RepID=A0A9Q9AVD0_9PEZI|nr:hypothetical protein Slin14017_G054540 [Septoria linicola]USW55820.1 hypothetical protein Slin15195_G091390 [Septoria linicola]